MLKMRCERMPQLFRVSFNSLPTFLQLVASHKTMLKEILRKIRLWLHRKCGFHVFNVADSEMKCVICGEKAGMIVRVGDSYTIKRSKSC